jgi:hypothetical protein
MTFIELCVRLVQEAGISGDGPSTIGGNVGEYQRVINWIRQSNYEIEMEHSDFDWMRKTVQFNTVANQPSYTPAECAVTDLGVWKMDSFRCYETAAGVGSEIFLAPVSYDYWRNEYQYNSRRNTTSRPTAITQKPSDRSLCLGDSPDGIYTVVGEYYREPIYMTADAEIPAMPSRYHMAIVYRAMMEYASYESAPEVYQRGELKYNEMLRRLEHDQMPKISLPGALA